MGVNTDLQKKELISIINNADEEQVEALYKILVEPLKAWQNFELSPEQKAELDEQKKQHRSGKSKSFTLSQVKNAALKKIRTK